MAIDDAGQDGLLAEARELYGVPAEEFVRARNDRAKQLKGDRGLSVAVAALPKPSVVAAALNAFARAQPAELAALLAHGERLRAASDPAEVRELSAATPGVVRDAARGVAAHGASGAEVEQTLRAALADPQAAAVLAAGVLVRPLVASGFGPVDLQGAVPVEPSAAHPAPAAPARARARDEPVAEGPDVPDERAGREAVDERKHAKRERDLAAAESAVQEAGTAVSHAREEESAATDEVERVLQVLEHARRTVAEAALLRRQAEKALERATARRDRMGRQQQHGS